MSKLMRVCALGVIASVLMSYGLACNTVKGAGEDTQKLGEKVSDSADRNKN